MQDYKTMKWWSYAEEPVRDLVETSIKLLMQEKAKNNYGEYHDYSFVVFSAAKGYEGFLKRLFFDMKLISSGQFNGDYFRIGKVLNPQLPKRYRAGWVYGKLVESCQGEELPLRLWETWTKARNKIFHFFPHHREFITLIGAEELLSEIMQTMEYALEGCGVEGR